MDLAKAAFDLDVVGAIEGTDKSSSVSYAWDYLRHYQDQFAPWRNEPINLIEIGVQRGRSLNVWKAYFSRANIVGIDIDRSCASLARDRVVIEIGSQEDPGFLHGVCAKYPPSIVIDDGSHLAHHIVFTFEQIFPALVPGGLYVVEDTEFQFGQHGVHWAGDGSVSVPDYFTAMARARMANRTVDKNLWGREKYFSEQIESIMFIGGAIFIRKRAPRDIHFALECADAYLSYCSPTPAHYVRYAEFILRHNGPLDRAAWAAREASSQGDPTPAALAMLTGVLERQGRLDEAADAAAAAAEKWPDQFDLWFALAGIQRRRRLAGAAVEAYRKAEKLRPNWHGLHQDLSQALEEAGDLRGALAAAVRTVELLEGDKAAQDHRAGRVRALRARLGEASP